MAGGGGGAHKNPNTTNNTTRGGGINATHLSRLKEESEFSSSGLMMGPGFGWVWEGR